jgi:hypothetical protein
MSRFNVRPIGIASPPPPPSVPHDKKPSAYAAMKGGSGNVVVHPPTPSFSEPVAEKTRKGRMTKDDVRRHKMDLASAGIQVLVVSKPNRNKIREYIKNRILQLDDEKR